MANETSSAKLKSHLQDLNSSLRDMQSSARLTDLRDRVEDLGGSISGLDQRILALRNKGYDFTKGWADIAPGIEREISREASSLARSLSPLESKLAELSGAGGAPALLLPKAERLKAEVENLEGRIKAVEENIRGAYDQFQSDVSKFEYHLGRLEWMVTELSEASFQLLAAESGIMAVKEVWAREGKQTKEDPEGVLYLTDQRLIFEQKEKVMLFTYNHF